MSRLIHAGFHRLRKDTAFRVLGAAVLILSLICSYLNTDAWRAAKDRGLDTSMEDYFFQLAPYMSAFFAVFVSLFIGTEYSDAAIRNKLIAGHTRKSIYFSNYIVCLFADLVLLGLWLLGQIPCFFTIGAPRMGMGSFAVYILVAVCFTASSTALFSLICMLQPNKALEVIFCLVLWVGLILAASGCNDRLCEVEMSSGMAYINGEFVWQEETPNPLYVSGSKRLVLECLLDVLPTGPAILMHEVSIDHPFREMALAAALTGAVCAIGAQAFQRKDIR